MIDAMKETHSHEPLVPQQERLESLGYHFSIAAIKWANEMFVGRKHVKDRIAVPGSGRFPPASGYFQEPAMSFKDF
jgi:hypothetical protein